MGGTNSANDFNDEFWDLDIDGTDVYACGSAGGTNLPSSVNSKMLSGSYYDGILAKFTTSGALTASKYTNGNVKNYSVRVFNSKVYCCGISKNGATNVNSGNYFYDNTCATGDFDACFSVHSLNLSTTIHNTFLGGTGTDEALENRAGNLSDPPKLIVCAPHSFLILSALLAYCTNTLAVMASTFCDIDDVRVFPGVFLDN